MSDYDPSDYIPALDSNSVAHPALMVLKELEKFISERDVSPNSMFMAKIKELKQKYWLVGL